MQRVLPEWETVVLLTDGLYCCFSKNKGKYFCYFKKKCRLKNALKFHCCVLQEVEG